MLGHGGDDKCGQLLGSTYITLDVLWTSCVNIVLKINVRERTFSMRCVHLKLTKLAYLKLARLPQDLSGNVNAPHIWAILWRNEIQRSLGRAGPGSLG